MTDYGREDRRGLRFLITERSALFTAAESGKALATSRSSTTTFDPSFNSRLEVLSPLGLGKASGCLPDHKPHVEAGTARDVHERVEAELLDPAFEQCVETRLGDT